MQEFQLGDLLEDIVGGGTPSKRNDDYWDGGTIPWASVKDMPEGKFRLKDTEDHITEEGLKNSSSNLIPKGTVITSTRMGLGRSFINEVDMAINQDLKALFPNGKLHNEFLLWWLASKANELESIGTGTTVKGIRLEQLRALNVNLPDLPIQKKIASILSAFDDMIENNTRRIEILEEMARRIYREWFVHFRYPGHQEDELVDSGTELGEIPEGWEVKKLEDVADINPENISTDYKGEIEYINISGVNEGSIDETEVHDFEEAPGRAKRRVKHGDIIWSSVRPNLKAYALILNPPANQIASTGFGVIRPEKLPSSFIYNFSTTEYFVQYLVNHTRGSAYPAVNVSDFKNAPIVVPDENLVEKFNEITWSNYLQIDKLSRKNKKLKETRDLMLPKLISGKIDVEEITVN